MKNKNIVSARNVTRKKPLSLHEYVEKFLISHDVKDISRESYRRRLRDFEAWIETSNLATIDRGALVAYKRSLRDRKLSSNTQSAYMVALRSFFAFLEASKIYPNLAKGIKGAKRDRSFRKDPLSISQVHRLLSSIDRSDLRGKRDYALLNLAIRTGPRSIEISRANLDDLRQEAGQTVLWLQGKGDDAVSEFVVITDEVLNPIHEYLAHRRTLKPTDALFGSTSDGNRNERLSTRAIRRIVKERLRDILIDNPRISAHSLRHTAATLALLAGSSLQEAQQLLRHQSINTTQIYLHNIDRAAGVPERKIDELLRNDNGNGKAISPDNVTSKNTN